jgi:lipopolysaccharide/colanic/teichoic acid biosynthesis glycosyltransferase
VKLDSKGPVFFLQIRVGKDAKVFQIIKFRTMHDNHNSSSTISIHGDTRMTSFGKFLRRSKIDELPELLNILKGEMSFVGPRPDVPGYADKLVGEDRKILMLKPGITSLASLKYSNEEKLLSIKDNPKYFNDNVIFPDKVRMNLKYYNNHNIWLDIKIIFATLFRLNY